jgi:protein SCO1/2
MAVSQRARQLAVPLAAFVFSLAVAAVALFLVLAPPKDTGAAVGGPFSLVNHDGKPVTERDFAGQPFLVFFGFTHCPDICPTTLFQISEMLGKMGEDGRNLRALFITVDSERDTPEVLRDYLSSFDDRIIGLTGDQAAVEAAVRTFRGYSRKVPRESGEYTMEHTSFVYLMGPDGNFLGTVNMARTPEEAARDVLAKLQAA